jgi:hypothetical protein
MGPLGPFCILPANSVVSDSLTLMDMVKKHG